MERRPPVAQQRRDDGQRLLEARHPAVVGEPEGGVLPLVPAGAQAHDKLGPAEIASTVAACLASIAGRVSLSKPRAGRFLPGSLTLARAARVVHASWGPRVLPSGRS